MFTKKASIVVNFDISQLFTHSRLAGAILNSSHDIQVIGLFPQIRASTDKHRKATEMRFPTNDVHDYNK